MAKVTRRTVTGGGKWSCTRCKAKGKASTYEAAQAAAINHKCPK